MKKFYYLILIFGLNVSCRAGSDLLIKNKDTRQGDVQPFEFFLKQVVGHYKNPENSMCLPDYDRKISEEIVENIIKAKEIFIVEVLQYNDYMLDMLINFKENDNPIYISILLGHKSCTTFFLSDHVYSDPN